MQFVRLHGAVSFLGLASKLNAIHSQFSAAHTKKEGIMAKNLILFDFNNLAHRCIHQRGLGCGADQRSWDLLAYMIFTIMYDFVIQCTEHLEPGDTVDVVLALDSKDGYWRRDIYPPYKADRTEKRAADGIDWPRAYAEFDKLTDAVDCFTPWKVVRVSQCEADDVIYALSELHQTMHPDSVVIIHSGDSDYLQLVSDNVLLYSPMQKEFVDFPHVCSLSGGKVLCASPAEYLDYAIITGQGGKDNVYNIKTPTDWDASSGKRKPGCGVAAARKMMASPEGLEACLKNNGLWENYKRNRQLIDMRELPSWYMRNISDAYLGMEARPCDMDGLLSIYVWPSIIAEKESYAATLDFLASGESGEGAGRSASPGIEGGNSGSSDLTDDPAFFL